MILEGGLETVGQSNEGGRRRDSGTANMVVEEAGWTVLRWVDYLLRWWWGVAAGGLGGGRHRRAGWRHE